MSAFTLRMLDARVRMRLEKNICKFYCTRNLAIFSSLTRLVGNLPTNQLVPVPNCIKVSLFLEVYCLFFPFQGNWVGNFSANLCEIFQQQSLPEIHWLLSRIWQIISLRNSKYKILLNEFSDGKIPSLSFRSVDGTHAVLVISSQNMVFLIIILCSPYLE